MVKMIYCLRRLPHLSEEEFQGHWREKHRQLVEKCAPALHLKRYVQCHKLATPLNEAMQQLLGLADPYDGVAELWWDSLEDLMDVMGSPEGSAASALLREDEVKFIDISRSCQWLNQEYTFIQ